MPGLRIAQNLPSANFFPLDILAPLRKKSSFPAKLNILIFNVSNAGCVWLSMCFYAIFKWKMHCTGNSSFNSISQQYN